ncbi:MAG TPA: zf-HC2 domain-containing protein [bacterium]|nr:zf-HC2 domain-containing protein [bacterium]HPN35033.1 zf-HC2 domain-containing protein [bacterium]
MNSRHLDDERIQNYLDGGLTAAENAEAQGHLAECDECRRQMEWYQKIYAGLGAGEPELFSSQWQDRVLQAVEGESLGFLHHQLRQVFAGVAVVLGLFKVSSLFMDYGSVVQSFRRPFLPSLHSIFAGFKFTADLAAWLHSLSPHLPLIASIIAALLFILLLDRLLSKARLRLLVTGK